MKENLEPKNDKGQRHGVCEYYWANGQLCYKYVFINGKKNGFAEWYGCGKITHKRYHL